VWNLTTRYGDLDISFVPTGTGGYDDLVRDAIEVELRGTRVQLASLADIVRSKDAAGRDKDHRALPVLRELLARQTRERAARRDG
jgi:predicted nucleotidyltransferase